MKKSDDKFEWIEEADTAFAQTKKSALHTTSVGRTKGKRAATTVYRSHISCGKHSISSREKRKKEKRTESRGRYISSAKYYLQQSKDTRIIKSLHTTYSQQQESYINILRCIQS
jgi:hypothetical protein